MKKSIYNLFFCLSILLLTACDGNYYTDRMCTPETSKSLKGLAGKYDLMMYNEVAANVTITKLNKKGTYKIFFVFTDPSYSDKPEQEIITTCKVGNRIIAESKNNIEKGDIVFSVNELKKKKYGVLVNRMAFDFQKLTENNIKFEKYSRGDFSTDYVVLNNSIDNSVLLSMMEKDPTISFMLVRSE